MRTKLIISYLGTNYSGWQVQANAPTVQGTLQKALRELYAPQTVSLTGCSRTDAGVHAYSYCCHFDVASNLIPPEKLPAALNVRLPYDIVVKEAQPVGEDFHARYSAVEKEYVYVIANTPVHDPFSVDRAYFCKYPLNIDLMSEAASHIPGRRDFSCFKAMGSNDGADPVRTVRYVNVERHGSCIHIYMCADGFLYNMARIIAGTLLKAASGKLRPEDVPDIIASRDRSRAGSTLPSHGLYLNKVIY